MTAERSYHHGNLRQAVLEAARAVIEQHGHDAVSMRELALQVQVSPSALYRHFSNRSALLVAIADQTHEQLGQELQRVTQEHPDPWRALEEACRAFVAFSQAHPGLFRMMYDDEVFNAPEAQTQLGALAQVYRMLLALFRRALPGASERELKLRQISMWSALYGYASSRSQGVLQPYMTEGLGPEDLERAMLDAALLRGAPRPD